MTQEQIDYSSFRESDKESLSEYWDNELSIGENVKNLINQAVALPSASIQVPIVTAYSLIHSALSNNLPILFLHGSRGSAKTELSKLIAGIHNVNMPASASSFAGLRNYINSVKWQDPEGMVGERDCCLIFENVNSDTLMDESLYTLLLCGYARASSRIIISKGQGQNFEFDVFSAKVISSIYPLYNEARFNELRRRCIVIKSKPWDNFTAEEQTEVFTNAPEFSVLSRLEFDRYDLSFLSEQFNRFWGAHPNLQELLDWRDCYETIREK